MQYPLAVVVPTYNRCDTLKLCMQHLEQQICKEFEVVIVDDGSTDATEAWVTSYLKRTPLSARYVRQQNSGPARARNLAVSLIQAPLTVFIGDDIFPSPQFTALHTQLHEQRPNTSVVGLGLTVWAEDGQRVTPFMRWMDTHGLQFNYGELLAGTTPDWKHFYTSNLSLKTELLRRFPFDESFPHAAMEDIEVACRMDVAHALQIVFLPDAIAHHLHPTTFSKACRRMETVGESSAHFDERWPGRLPREKKSLTFRLGQMLAQVPLAMPVLEKLADQSLKIACPNRLMTFVLNYHFNEGYNRHRHQPR